MALQPCQGCGKPVDTTAKVCPGCGRPSPTASSMGRGLLIVLILGGIFFLYQVGKSVGGSTEPATAAATPERSEQKYDPLDDDDRFDLIDMLPERAGGLSILAAIPFKGRGSFQTRTSKAASGRLLPGSRTQPEGTWYPWRRNSRRAQLPSNAFATTLRPRILDASDKLSRMVKVGDLSACFTGAERGCPYGLSGAAISWPGCTIDFRCDDWGKRTAKDAIAVAKAVERWARRFREDKSSIPAAEVRTNRQALLEAVRRADP
jgi:hypothetical protein